MRESSRIEKTKLPVDVYEGWLKTQATQPEKGRRVVPNEKDAYEAWIGKRVEKKAQENKPRRKRTES
ncbi:MAG: hypothetical protein OK438_05055 [Thaumarchaeota archaeon]|nr:hypothetical protein [Nitrososphaerota archaeon]